MTEATGRAESKPRSHRTGRASATTPEAMRMAVMRLSPSPPFTDSLSAARNRPGYLRFTKLHLKGQVWGRSVRGRIRANEEDGHERDRRAAPERWALRRRGRQ